MEDEINLLDILRVLIKRKWIIIGVALIFFFGAWFTSARQPRLYKAATTIMVSGGGGGGLSEALSAFSFLGTGGQMRGVEGKIIALLQSANLAQRVSQDLDLPTFFPKLFENSGLSEEKISRIVAGSLRGAVEAKNVDGLLRVSVIWRDPEQAAELANLYVKQLDKFLKYLRLKVEFQVIDPAVAPKFHFKPRVKKNAMLGGLAGVFMGVFIAFFLEYIERLLKT